jgi:two-component system, LuxR family, sensor kinase FixL
MTIAQDTREMSKIGGVSALRSYGIAFERIFILPGSMIGLAYLAGYVLLDWVSFVHPFTPFGIIPWNPGAGLGFVMVLLFGRRTLPYLFLAPILADFVNVPTPPPWGVELLSAALIGGAYAAATMVLLHPTIRFNPSLRSLRDLSLLMIVAVVSAGFVAAGYVGLIIVAGLLPAPEMAAAALRYWVGDLIGIIIVTPFGLIALTRQRVLHPTIENALQLAAIVAALVLVFGIAQEQQLQLFYLLFLPIIWIAVRTGLEGVIVGIMITQLGLIVGVYLFREDPRDLMPFQVLMLVLATTGLIVGELVTERRRTELQLRLHREALAQLARIGNLGELAAAVAHEINQPLAAAGTYTRFVSTSLREGDSDLTRLAETAEKAAGQVQRAAEVVRRLRALVRLDRTARAPCSVEQIVKDSIALCQPGLDHTHIIVRWTAPAKLPRVMVDILQIEQTLLNLIKNSIEAISENKHRNGVIDIKAVLQHSDMVEIQVADNGPGFSPDFADAFLPFTSKKAEGLGVGLPLCRTIVEAHGGLLWLNREARGAEVRFTLPVAKEI